MKKAEIISVGTELLMGQVANTDAQYISGLLPSYGFAVYYHIVVGDNRDRLSECIRESLGRADLVVLTGGLGPTEDDLTKKTVAEVLGLEMIKDAKTESELFAYFSKTGRNMSPSNLSQAYFPEGSTILENDFGTAPGCLIKKTVGDEEKIIILLPGPPSELCPMFKNKALPLLKEEGEDVLLSKFFDISGVPESEVERILSDIISGRTNPTVATYVKDGLVTVRVSASGQVAEAEQLIEEDAKIIRERFGGNIVSENRQSPAEVLVRLCEREKLMLTAAESCTGGMIAEMITSVPGASNVIGSSFVTYSNDAKIRLLGVDDAVIEKYGCVSRECAKMMAEGAAKAAGADVGVSTTGNAGPGTLEDKPAGLVYIGVYYKGETVVKECYFKGGRDHVRRRASNTALETARRMILGIEAANGH